jgi:ligand-binding sensor domain-containing protein/signal transduction histidine kinase
MEGGKVKWWFGCLASVMLLPGPAEVPAFMPTTSRDHSGPVGGEFRVRCWTVEDGLPQNTANCLLQTRDGYLWVGTSFGLARFDGRRFTVFNKDNTPALALSDTCTALTEDTSTATLWIGTRQGVVAKHGAHWSRLTTNDGLCHDGVLSLWASPRTGLWIGTERGLACYRHGAFAASPHGDARSWIDELVNCIFEDQAGLLYAGLLDGLVQVNPSNGELHPLQNATPDGYPHPVLAITAASPNGLWFGGWDGLHRWQDGKETKFQWSGAAPLGCVNGLFEDPLGHLWVSSSAHGLHTLSREHLQLAPCAAPLSSRLCKALIQDREGNVWVGTKGGGLNQIMPRGVAALTTRDGLMSDTVWSVSAAPDGAVWIATDDGVTRWRHGAITNFTRDNGLIFQEANRAQRGVGVVLADRAGRVWAGGQHLFMCYTNGQWRDCSRLGGHLSLSISCLFEDRAGDLWFAAGNRLNRFKDGQLTLFPPGDELPDCDIRAIFEDRVGRLWIGTYGAGLVEWITPPLAPPAGIDSPPPAAPPPRSGAGRRIYTTRDGLSHNRVWLIHEDSDGALWLGTENGLNRFKDGRFFVFTRAQGLFDNLVNHLEEDDQGFFWLSCNRGIFRVSRRELDDVADGRTPRVHCLLFGEADGLPNAETNGEHQPAGCRTPDGRLWFPTQGGVVALDPKTIRLNTNPPPVVIEQVLADKEVVYGDGLQSPLSNFASPIHFPAGRARSLIIRYTASSFLSPDRVRFRYRLEGHDQDWLEDNSNLRTAIYTDLRPGTYRFRVRAFNNHGLPSERDAEFAFTLAPFFYQTWPFYGLCALGVLTTGGALHTVRMRGLRRIKELEQLHMLDLERARIAQDMHDGLGADLTRIAILADRAQHAPHTAQSLPSHLQKVGTLARALIDSISELVWATNPRHNTLDSLAAYLRQYASELLEPSAFHYHFDFPKDIPPLPISGETRQHLFLATKEALNNALKHSGATDLTLRFALTHHHLEILVADNGRGFLVPDPRPETGVSDLEPPTSNLPPRRSGGNGLHNLRERLQAIGGSLEVASAPGQGTQVRLSAPLPAGKLVSLHPTARPQSKGK